jgi:hypothetical protein
LPPVRRRGRAAGRAALIALAGAAGWRCDRAAGGLDGAVGAAGNSARGEFTGGLVGGFTDGFADELTDGFAAGFTGGLLLRTFAAGAGTQAMST